jgi:Ca2+/Na+ antiporter
MTMTRRPTSVGGWTCVAGGAIGIACGLYTGFISPQVGTDRWSYPYAPTGYVVAQLVFALNHVMLLAGIVALARVAPASGRLWRAGIRTTVAGLVLYTACELWALAYTHSAKTAAGPNLLGGAYGISTLLIGVGLILAGVAVIRQRQWHGWRRLTPLIGGIAVFVVVLPGVFGPFLAGRLAIAVWMVLWAALGAATVVRTGNESPSPEPPGQTPQQPAVNSTT